jgi:hypothetical protein
VFVCVGGQPEKYYAQNKQTQGRQVNTNKETRKTINNEAKKYSKSSNKQK